MNISKFKIVVMAIFIIGIIAGVAAFAMYRGGNSKTEISPITVWGTFPSDVFDLYVANVNNKIAETVSVTYVQKNQTSFSQEFVSALARGTGPDAILVPVDMLLPHYDKLVTIPFDALPKRTFIDSYIEEANIYLVSNGILALPFTVDPLIMYWNRDTFNGAGIATYPRYWDEFTTLNTKLTKNDQNGNVRKSAIALGDFTNLNNAREILGSLLMQTGNPVTAFDANGSLESTLKTSAAVSPTTAINFFTQFSNPSSPNYSWNRGMPTSKSSFLAGDLATYFGFASEISDIREKNPNLNFDAAPFPQIRSGGLKAAYGRLHGFSVVRSSPVPNDVFQIMTLLTDPMYLTELNNTMYLPSIHRDLIAQGSTDPYVTIFNEAALIAKTWIDADPVESRSILANMIQEITSGQKSDFQAIQDAGDQYDAMLQKALQ
ncbi:MAG: extracellular solute-binding protein [bacterium]|nr:extracellular solute-binding protein [bacterium]